jgi:hypothetical protein
VSWLLSLAMFSLRRCLHVLMLGLQHPASAVDVQMYALAHAGSWLEHAIRDLASSLARWYCAIDTLGEDDWFGKRRLAFPSKLAVLFCADL